jgi:hypothetical protein
MQFKPDLIGMIRYGHKTQTRRPTSPEDSIGHRGRDVLWVRHRGRLRWEVGRCYSVCPGRGLRAVGSIRLTAIRQEPVYAITEADARAEGFQDASEFRVRWQAMYPHAGPNDMAWVLTFELVTMDAP